MKHQALARVFSVVLAIMCLLMLLNGATGFGKAAKAHEERIAFENKFAQRIENYVTLHEQVENSISYDEAYKLLKEKLEQHDKDAAQHRTDTALYTAEKGGNTMGANLIWEAMPEVEGARQELEAGKKKLAEMETAYAANKGTIDETIATANSGIAHCNQASASLAALPAKLAPLMAEQATLPPMPEEPARPEIVEDPGSFDLAEPQQSDYVTLEKPTEPTRPVVEDPENPTEEEQQQLADYEAQMLTFTEENDAYNGQMNAYLAALEEYNREKEEYDRQLALYQTNDSRQQQYEIDMAAYYGELAIYSEAQATFQSKVAAQLAPEIALVQSISEEMNTCISNSQAVAGAMGVDMGDVGDIGFGDLAMPSEEELASMTPEQMMGLMQQAVSMMSSGFQQIASGMGAIEGELEKARYMVVVGEEALKKAEAEMHTQLANIWYNLGQLEEKADDLREEKERLDLEALGLDKELMETDELKLLKNRHISARQLLINIPEVKSSYAETEDLEVSARSYLEDYREETRRLNQGRRLINLLAVLGGVFGVLGIPGAYEKLRGRFWLIAPVLLCLGCAAAADWVNMRLGLGQMYTALFTAIFAVIDLLIILPRKKALPSE